MKYMFIMRATDEAIEASKQVPFEEILNKMGAYNESLIKAGVMLAGEGLADVSEGTAFVVDFSEEPPVVTDGPYGETHELFNGFWIVQVSSKEEAAEWASSDRVRSWRSAGSQRLTTSQTSRTTSTSRRRPCGARSWASPDPRPEQRW